MLVVRRAFAVRTLKLSPRECVWMFFCLVHSWLCQWVSVANAVYCGLKVGRIALRMPLVGVP